MPDLLEREFHPDHGTGRLYSRLVMNTGVRQAILERNKELRLNPGVIQDLSFGRQMLSIPELDYWHLRKKYPDLFDGPVEDRRKALKKFLRSPESTPYMVR